ncbi:MAG: YceK/YidQ family lipoprotein [Myxococcota bacterium]
MRSKSRDRHPRAGRRATAALALAAALCGCQSMRSLDQGCPGVYSGLRYYRDQVGEIPFDGKIFFTLDLPLSAVTDTLLLPFMFAVDHERPPLGWPIGCRWAKK